MLRLLLYPCPCCCVATAAALPLHVLQHLHDEGDCAADHPHCSRIQHFLGEQREGLGLQVGGWGMESQCIDMGAVVCSQTIVLRGKCPPVGLASDKLYEQLGVNSDDELRLAG